MNRETSRKIQKSSWLFLSRSDHVDILEQFEDPQAGGAMVSVHRYDVWSMLHEQ